MASSLRTCLLLFVALFVVLEVDTKLSCLTCDSKEECTKVPEELAPKECTNDRHLCVKIVDENGKVINRGCNTQYQCDTFLECHSCIKDKCNSSSALLPSFLIFGLVINFFIINCL